jgi:stage IV sporulation protein FA
MFEEVERVKGRRRERMERIRTETRDGFAPFVDDWKDSLEPRSGSFSLTSRHDDERTGLPPQEKMGIQAFASVLLVGLAFWLFHTSLVPAAWKESARQIMTRDFNFAGVVAWSEQKFGKIPTILPAFSAKQAAPSHASAGPTEWKLPASWRVVKTFEPNNAKVVFNTGPDGQVTVGEVGWVTYVGEKPGFGNTVVIRLQQGREVWYGNLEQVNVARDDFLRPGQVVGMARAVSETSRYLYMGMKEKETFINPLDVISFE